MAQVDYNAMAEDDFRKLVRDFIEAECPPSLRYRARRVRWAEIKPWTLKLSKRGWIAPAWPLEHGGMGLDGAKLLAYHEEFDNAGVAKAPDQGIVNLGMFLLRFGTDAQKNYYLPRIVSCQDVWCQGYSEPGSGSDLASLRTKAVLDGDHWVVNGSKIWTTFANDATDIFLLVRTDPAAKKQEGISFLLARIDTPGIRIRPIKTLAGDEEFCEVFFDDVRIPKANIVGKVNEGWTMAKALLGFERLFLGSPKLPLTALARLEAFARATGAFADARFVETFTSLHLDVRDLSSAYERFANIVRKGGALGSEVSLLKIWSTQTQQRISEVFVEVANEYAPVSGGVMLGNEQVDALGNYFLARPSTIYGGSNEIQRNILAKAVLGLPS